MTAAKATTDHSTIRRWVEARGGHPARVLETGQGDDPGILRIEYPGRSGEGTLEALSWDDFFDAFESNELAFLYTDEENSRFSKLVHRDTVDADEEEDEDDEDDDDLYADDEEDDEDEDDEDDEDD